jgi:hypothetical protein
MCDGCSRQTCFAMRYDVTAVELNPQTGVVVAGPRTERIDPETNFVFEGCEGPWDIEDAYETFWNRINNKWEYEFPRNQQKVKVLCVEPVET